MIRSLAATFVAGLVLVVGAGLQSGCSDPLPSWNDGPTKQAILDFGADVTDRRSPNDVKPADRIATPDNDGTRVRNQRFTIRDESVFGPQVAHLLSLAITGVAAA